MEVNTMIATILLGILILFVVIDILQGLRRGLYASLTRLASIALCIVGAFFLAQYLGNHILEMSIVYEGEKVLLGDLARALLESNEDLASIFEYSPTLKELALHLPEVLAKEILFLPLFFILRLVSLPIVGIINKIAFPRKKRDENGKKVKIKRKKYHLFGMLVGAVQGALCFAIIMVPIFGLSDFSAIFVNQFKNSDSEQLRALSETLENEFVSPLSSSFIVKTMDKTGVHDACSTTFTALSHTTIQNKKGEVKDVEYFHTLESTLPAVDAFVHLSSVMDSVDGGLGNLSSEDYSKLSDAFATASKSEAVADVLTEVTGSMVKDTVGGEYQETAGKITDIFVQEVIAKNNESDTAVDLEKELGAMQEVLNIMDSATSSGVENVFSEKDVDSIVDTIISTDVAYTTFVKAVKDEETVSTIKSEIALDEAKKEDTKAALDDFLAEKQTTATPEEFERIQAAVDAIAGMLDITLNELPAGAVPEIPEDFELPEGFEIPTP